MSKPFVLTGHTIPTGLGASVSPSMTLPSQGMTAALTAPSLSIGLAVPTPLPDDGKNPTLVDTLSAEMPDLGRMPEAEATAAAESDFMLRARLSRGPPAAPASDGGSAGIAASPSRLSAPSHSAPETWVPAVPKPWAARRDDDGRLMARTLERLSGSKEALDLDFTPSARSLKVLAEFGRGSSRDVFEVFLFRDRATGRWRAARGGLHGVEGEFGDYDMAVHNHADLRMGAYSVYSPYPSPQDLVTSAGKKARFFVVSAQGAVEWSPDIPFADEPGRLLSRDAGSQERSRWLAALEGTFWRRLVMRVLYTTGFYPRLLDSIGVAAKLKPWKHVTDDWFLRGEAPLHETVFTRHLLPKTLADELSSVGPKVLGKPLPESERTGALKETAVRRVLLRHHFTDEIQPVPDGITRGTAIQLNVRPAWKDYASADHHFRVLFTHEYAHRLQGQGLWTFAYGVEIPAVGVELLRALELAPLAKLASGHIDFIGQGVLDGFEEGRRWLREGGTGSEVFYRKGALAGAAYELSLKTGRHDDAWEFVRRVCEILPGQKAGQNPSEAAAAILSRFDVPADGSAGQR